MFLHIFSSKRRGTHQDPYPGLLDQLPVSLFRNLISGAVYKERLLIGFG